MPAECAYAAALASGFSSLIHPVSTACNNLTQIKHTSYKKFSVYSCVLKEAYEASAEAEAYVCVCEREREQERERAGLLVRASRKQRLTIV